MNCSSPPKISGYTITSGTMSLLVTYEFFSAIEGKLGKFDIVEDFFIAVEDGTNEVVGVSSPFRTQNGRTQTDIIIFGEDELNIPDRTDFGVSLLPNRYVSIYLLKGGKFYKIGQPIKFSTNYFEPLFPNTSIVEYCTPNFTNESYNDYLKSLYNWWKSDENTYISFLQGDYPSEYDVVFDDQSDALSEAEQTYDEQQAENEKWDDFKEQLDSFRIRSCPKVPDIKTISLENTGSSQNVLITRELIDFLSSRVGKIDFTKDFFLAISESSRMPVGISDKYNTAGLSNITVWGQESRLTESDPLVNDFGVPYGRDEKFLVLLVKGKNLYKVGDSIEYATRNISVPTQKVYEYCTLEIDDSELDEMHSEIIESYKKYSNNWSEYKVMDDYNRGLIHEDLIPLFLNNPDFTIVEDVIEITDPIEDIAEDIVEDKLEQEVLNTKPTITTTEQETIVDPPEIVADNQGFYDKGFDDGVASVDITSDNDAVFNSAYNKGYQEGYSAVDLQAIYDSGIAVGSSSVDITSDNQAVYDEAFQKGVDSVDTTPQIVGVEKKENNRAKLHQYATPAIIGVVALFMLFGKK